MNEGRPKNPNERPAEAVQDDFLNRLRREQKPVTVLLTDGTQLAGRIKSFDRFSILLESQGQEQLLFKHAIASIAPSPAKAT
jgi:host factor-I protein